MTDKPADVVIPGESLDLIGSILTANVKWSQDISNRVEENLQREALEWKRLFLQLYKDVDEAQRHARNMDIEEVLQHHGWNAHNATQPSYFEPEFRRGF